MLVLQFYALLQDNDVAMMNLQLRKMTVFAPTNLAFQRLKKSGNKLQPSVPNSIVLYHMMNVAQTLSELDTSVTTLYDGSPQLWVTKERKPGPGDREDVYINNAMILHVIDEVLFPIMGVNTDNVIENPDAYQFVTNSDVIQLETHRIRSFRQRVNQNNKQGVFKASGRHTFFMPVDEGFKVLYVSSNTVLGDANHATGVVLAEIVKANIPVRNGVVHLIHRPLMVVDTTVTQFLEEKEDGPLHKFYQTIMDHHGDFMTRINLMKELTLFAPSNQAWESPVLKNIIGNNNKMRDILNMHVVPKKLPLDRIISENIFEENTLAARKKLYFNVVEGPHNNHTLTVEGGGVNATVIQHNIAATNGFVHIIDRVLGVPYATVYEKLASDPALNKTFFLGNVQRFNEQLKDNHKRFTFFVPRDAAWDKAELHFPTAHKKLFMRDFQYHAQQILERHLIVDKAFSMAELKAKLANESTILPTVRDEVHLKVKEIDQTSADAAEPGYYLEWQGERVLVSRPDVECTNGVIHVIDMVLLRDTDVRVSATGTAGVTLPFLLAQLAALLLARLML
ncbi:hypothetical protein B566_EDAN008322 [Ephemera danica]|nr:hypothetical protein B566_EDAN008322 [Ephemera danica]